MDTCISDLSAVLGCMGVYLRKLCQVEECKMRLVGGGRVKVAFGANQP